MAFKLYAFQGEYLRAIPRRFVFSADTGTGKTIMSLYHYEQYGYPRPLLIVGPAAKMRTGDWQRHVEEYFAGQKMKMLEVHYYSYEKFSRTPTVKEYRRTGEVEVWRKWVLDHPLGNYAVIADECHRLANPQSGIGRAMFNVCHKADFFIGLSATALPNGWISAANYFKIFGFTRNITEFKKRYCNIQTYKGFPEIVNYYHEDELKKLWNCISKPLKKEQALDLPPVTIVPVTLEAGNQYLKVIKERTFGNKFLDNPSALLHALRQSVMEPKVAWLNEFLEGVSSNVVIFYNYVSERDAMLAMLNKHHKGRQVFRQDGERHQLPDQSLWPELHRTITLAQYQSGSTGVEMQYADTIVFLSPNYSYTLYHQALGRIERIGQTQKMTVYKLCAPTTVEKAIWMALKNKQSFDELQWYKANLAAEQEFPSLVSAAKQNT